MNLWIVDDELRRLEAQCYWSFTFFVFFFCISWLPSSKLILNACLSTFYYIIRMNRILMRIFFSLSRYSSSFSGWSFNAIANVNSISSNNQVVQFYFCFSIIVSSLFNDDSYTKFFLMRNSVHRNIKTHWTEDI